MTTTFHSSPADRLIKPKITSVVFTTLVGVTLGLLVVLIQQPFIILLIIFGLLAVFTIITKIEYGLYLLIFITFTNFSSVIVDYHNGPSVAKALVLLLIIGILVREIFSHYKTALGLNRLALALAIYGIVCLASILYAPETQPALKTIWYYLKDSFLAILVVVILALAVNLSVLLPTISGS